MHQRQLDTAATLYSRRQENDQLRRQLKLIEDPICITFTDHSGGSVTLQCIDDPELCSERFRFIKVLHRKVQQFLKEESDTIKADIKKL